MSRKSKKYEQCNGQKKKLQMQKQIMISKALQRKLNIGQHEKQG